MVSGRQLTKEFRRFIYNHFFNDVNPLSPKNLHRIVFGGRNDIITLSYLKKLYTKFNKNDDAENQLYLYDDGNVKIPSKRNKKHDDVVKGIFLYYHSLGRNRFLLLDVVTRNFNSYYYIDPANGPSESTIKRWLKEDRQRRKKVEHRNINKCPVQQAAFMDEMGHIHPSNIYDTDGMSAAPKTMLQEYGRSKIGERCYYPQFVIGTHTFSVLATICDRGVVYYQIYEDTMVDHEIFITYMGELEDYLLDGAYGIIDNAAVHKHLDSLIAINTAFKGLYSFSSPYSPELKPVERLFACIRKHIKRNAVFAEINPRQALVNAFEEYAVHGPSGHICKNFFNLYQRNYDWTMNV